MGGLKRNAVYGRFFTYLPQIKGFLLEAVWPERAVCRTCGGITEGGVLCSACESRLRSDGMIAAWDREDLENNLSAYTLRPHTGVARKLVIRLKHSAEKCLAEELAGLIRPVPEYISFPPDTVVTWVPMPENRRRERCIDHGRLLAEAAAVQLELSCRPLLLRRDTRSRPQATLGQQERIRNLSGVFFTAEKIHTPVLLIDDVLTTGTTARRCAEALRAGGAREITVLAFTRATGGRSGLFPPH